MTWANFPPAAAPSKTDIPPIEHFDILTENAAVTKPKHPVFASAFKLSKILVVVQKGASLGCQVAQRTA
jgi:hypothetical protein